MYEGNFVLRYAEITDMLNKMHKIQILILSHPRLWTHQAISPNQDSLSRGTHITHRAQMYCDHPFLPLLTSKITHNHFLGVGGSQMNI